MKNALVSVIIPTFNRGSFISRAVESVLAQSWPRIEVIVVDDGSTDGTRERLAPFASRITYLTQERSGPAAARNLGLSAAKGEFVAFLDSDDIWSPSKIGAQVEYLSSHPDEGAVHTGTALIDDRENVIEALGDDGLVQSGNLLRTMFLWKSRVVLSSLMVRRECIERVGGFDASLRTAEDWHFITRLAHEYPFGYLPESLLFKRAHDESLTSRAYSSMKNNATFLSLRKAFDLFPEMDGRMRRTAFTLRYFHYGYINFRRREFRLARSFFLKALGCSAFNMRAWQFLALSCVPWLASRLQAYGAPREAE